MQIAKWPKVFPPLTPEQQRINDDFMKQWHEVLPNRYAIVERFNHEFPVKHSRQGFVTTLEIGAGLGEHVNYEKLTPEQEKNYFALELRENMAAKIREHFPRIHAITGDCQARIDFPDGYFDRYIAVHVLEHLPNLPLCVREAYRLINKEHGQLLVVIPCEGSPAYGLARRISAQRLFEKKYGVSYDIFIKREHINLPNEILAELDPYFNVEFKRLFPLFFLPFIFNNLCIGLVLKPRDRPLASA